MIDVHVLHMDDENPQWAVECSKSLEGEPCKVFDTLGIKGKLGEARKLAFTLGKSELVSYVDPDDRVLPNMMIQCIAGLVKHPECVGAYCDYEYIDEEGNILGPSPFTEVGYSLDLLRHQPRALHGLTVMRRSVVDKVATVAAPLHYRHSHILYQLVANYGSWLKIKGVGYQWRQHKGNMHKMRDPSERYLTQRILAKHRKGIGQLVEQ